MRILGVLWGENNLVLYIRDMGEDSIFVYANIWCYNTTLGLPRGISGVPFKSYPVRFVTQQGVAILIIKFRY